ncbi:hypothetical protein [Limimaricola pyoseonensis]|uniref:hypothetical protein n=1 Tax=Limimaricola pyoseonensis TaxID=521013 RepID=UPI0010424872|nr:hypothetical protein [Limimaricola pyoseonensis]
MPSSNLLHPGANDCDRFLFAPVGEDRNGYVVTVLSALARLGLDPWKEASDLATMPRSVARERLDRLLTRFRDVPTLKREHAATAERLSLLLPERFRPRAALRHGDPLGSPTLSSLPIFWLLMILLALAQILYFGRAGAGE